MCVEELSSSADPAKFQAPMVGAEGESMTLEVGPPMAHCLDQLKGPNWLEGGE
jgi:hypothetical protein